MLDLAEAGVTAVYSYSLGIYTQPIKQWIQGHATGLHAEITSEGYGSTTNRHTVATSSTMLLVSVIGRGPHRGNSFGTLFPLL